MATVTIQQAWPDGSTLAVEIDVEESFPDAVAEAKRAALDAYAEALALSLAGLGDDEAGE